MSSPRVPIIRDLRLAPCRPAKRWATTSSGRCPSKAAPRRGGKTRFRSAERRAGRGPRYGQRCNCGCRHPRHQKDYGPCARLAVGRPVVRPERAHRRSACPLGGGRDRSGNPSVLAVQARCASLLAASTAGAFALITRSSASAVAVGQALSSVAALATAPLLLGSATSPGRWAADLVVLVQSVGNPIAGHIDRGRVHTPTSPCARRRRRAGGVPRSARSAWVRALTRGAGTAPRDSRPDRAGTGCEHPYSAPL